MRLCVNSYHPVSSQSVEKLKTAPFIPQNATCLTYYINGYSQTKKKQVFKLKYAKYAKIVTNTVLNIARTFNTCNKKHFKRPF